MTDFENPDFDREDAQRGVDTIHPDFAQPSQRSVELSVLGQVRSYTDEQLLERAWQRLETRGVRSSAMKPVARFLAAAALLAAGFAAGRFTEQSEQTTADALASRELLTVAEVPAGPRLQPGAIRRTMRRNAAESRTATDESSSDAGMNRRLVRRPAIESEMLDEEFIDEGEYELVAEEPATQAVRPVWLVLAERGDFAGAFQLLDESGGFDSVLQSGSAEELMTLVDVARYVGNQGRAIQALRVVTERHQEDANAPLAAMMLGNLLSRAGDQAGAASAFALNRRLSPGGDFAEDALVREFDMAVAAVDLPTALRLSSQYDEEFPQGRHQKELRAEVARLRQSVAENSQSSGADSKSDQAATKDIDAEESESVGVDEGKRQAGPSSVPNKPDVAGPPVAAEPRVFAEPRSSDSPQPVAPHAPKFED